MLRASYRELRSGKILELKPLSFAQLLRYLESRLSSDPKLLRKTRASRHITHRISGRAREPRSLELVPTLWNRLMMLLVFVGIFITWIYFRRSLWDGIPVLGALVFLLIRRTCF